MQRAEMTTSHNDDEQANDSESAVVRRPINHEIMPDSRMMTSRLAAICMYSIWWVLLWMTLPVVADTSTPLALDHEAYELLERLEVRGVIAGVPDGMKPLSQERVSTLLSGALGSPLLTDVDRQRLEELTQLLGTDTTAVDEAMPPVKGEWLPPRLRYQTPTGWMELDLLARQQTDLLSGRRDGDEWILRNRLGAIVRGQIGRHVGFRVSFEQTREEGVERRYAIRSDVLEPRREAVQLKGGVADYHEATAVVGFGLGEIVDVVMGKGQVMWGPAPDDNLGLSANTPSYDMILLRSQLGVIRFEHLAARLRPCPDRPDAPTCSGIGDPDASYIVNGMTRSLERDKYLAGHRLEISPRPWIDIGFQEVVIYGDRGPELAYLNPFMFFWAAQSYLGDKDNVMMTFDVDVRPRTGWRFYAAYAIDDLKKLKILSDDFANKFSLQVGGLWTEPMGASDTDVRAEYVRIEPWIYSHKFPINTFRHFDAPLGHSLGPNSDRWQISIERRWRRDLATRLRWSRSRHGDNELLSDGTIRNVGGDLHLGWRPGDDRQVKKFLDGNVSTWNSIGLDLEFRVWSRLHLVGTAEWEDGTNVPLAPRWQRGVPLLLRTGYGDGWQTHLAIDLRYGLL